MIRIDGVFDIECASWDRFSVGVTLSAAGHCARWDDPETMTAFLRAHGGTWWAHCGGRYDVLQILEILRLRGVTCPITLAGGRVSGVVIKGGLVLRDSWHVCPMGLDRAVQMVNRGSQSLDQLGCHWRCECGLLCGGYCRIQRRMPEGMRSQLADYCEQDCRDLLDVLRAIQAHCQSFNLDLKGTIGSSAYATAKRMLRLPDNDLPIPVWRRIRDAYYGGRVTVCRPRVYSGPVYHWDQTSAYPAALANHSMPVGDPEVVGGKRASKLYSVDRPGFYAVEVTVPECYLPPLPIHAKNRTSYPWGTFRGTWSAPELRNAEASGAKITGFISGVVYPRTANVFKPLFDHLYRVRRTVGKQTALGEWTSLYAKSISGKLAESPNRETAILFPDRIRFCPRTAPCGPRHCSGRCRCYRQMDHWGELWAVPFFKMSTCAHIEWAAYCTSIVRSNWLSAALISDKELVSGNTDSIWTTSHLPPVPVGDGLGEWSLRATADEWHALSPGTYRYKEHGRWVSRSSGIAQLTEEEWDRVERGEHVIRSRGVMSLSQAALTGKGLFRRDLSTWTAGGAARERGQYGDRLLDTEERITIPPQYGHLDEADRSREI